MTVPRQQKKFKVTRHVVPYGEGSWANQKGGSSGEPTSIHKEKADAIKAAQRCSKKEHADLYIHRADGTVEFKAHLE